MGADKSVLRPGALNPWAGTGISDDADPVYPDWDSVGDEDLDRLMGVARVLIEDFQDGLLRGYLLDTRTIYNVRKTGLTGWGRSAQSQAKLLSGSHGPNRLLCCFHNAGISFPSRLPVLQTLVIWCFGGN